MLRIPGRRHGYIARRADQESQVEGGACIDAGWDNRLIAFLISGRGI